MTKFIDKVSSDTYLRRLASNLSLSDRLGSLEDSPEGSRYIVISDTLVNELVEDLIVIADRIRDMKETLTHHYVLVRTDIPLPQQVVQACHAVYSTATMHDPILNLNLVLCSVKSEAELEKWQEKLHAANIDLFTFYEPDIGNAATALATLPVTEKQRKIFNRLKLWNPP